MDRVRSRLPRILTIEAVWRPLGGPDPLSKPEYDGNTDGLPDGTKALMRAPVAALYVIPEPAGTLAGYPPPGQGGAPALAGPAPEPPRSAWRRFLGWQR